MTININDLGDRYAINDTSPLASNRSSSNNLNELSPQELKISGGASYRTPRTVIIGDDDLDVYIIDDTVRTNVVRNADFVKLEPGEEIDFDNGSVSFRRNGDLDITISVSDFSSSS